MSLLFSGGGYTNELRDWISSGDNLHIITQGWVVIAAIILASLLAGPVLILAILLSSTVKLAGMDGGWHQQSLGPCCWKGMHYFRWAC